MESCRYLLDLSIILLSTKLLSIITRKFYMPQVVGALMAGLLLGPAFFGVIKDTSFIAQLAELGVIVLMFSAGLETDVAELKKSGKASIVIALLGVIVPLAGGFAVAAFFNDGVRIPSDASVSVFLQNIFIGIILTATSVSITVETLKEMGKLNTRAGNAILGAAIIDDILGIIALTIVTSFADSSVNVWLVLGKLVLFLVLAGLLGIVINKMFNNWTGKSATNRQRYIIVAFVFCLLMSFAAEEFFGVADITGAYLAGLIISNTSKKRYIERRFATMSYMLLSPMFFASIGINVSLPEMSMVIVVFACILTVVAVLTKVLGCGLASKMFKFSNSEALQVGVGMVSRGEVALVIANKGTALGLLSTNLLGPVVIVVIVTTVIAPILLKVVFSERKKVQEEV